MQEKNKILVFGNVLVRGDDLPKLIPELKKKINDIEFIEADPTETIENYGRDLKIIDAVAEIDKVKVLKLDSKEDFEKLLLGKVYSMHDFDLGYNLRLLKKLGKIDSAEIICVPMGWDGDRIVEGIKKIVK